MDEWIEEMAPAATDIPTEATEVAEEANTQEPTQGVLHPQLPSAPVPASQLLALSLGRPLHYALQCQVQQQIAD